MVHLAASSLGVALFYEVVGGIVLGGSRRGHKVGVVGVASVVLCVVIIRA